MPLTRVGRYRLADVLGVGMFSRVVVGVDDESGARYAIKVMNKRRLEELNMDQYARREAVVLHRVRHPNVVEFVEAIQSPKKLFLVMQIAPGRELLDVVREGPVPEADARIYMRQLVDAVACLHEHCYAHRDIKPSNVLVDTASKKLTLIDLGLAGVIRRYHPMQTRCGSDFYKAPETLALGSQTAAYDGVKVDAWSVGLLAYILLTGTHPFVDRFGQLMFDNLRTGKLEFPPTMPSSAVSFVSCLLTLSARKRSSVAAIRTHQWLNPSAAAVSGTPATSVLGTAAAVATTAMPLSHADMSVKRPRASVADPRGSRGVALSRIFSRSGALHEGAGGSGASAAGGAPVYEDRRESVDRDRRRSKGSTSSFLWFRRSIHDEYGEDHHVDQSRSFIPRMSKEIPSGTFRTSSHRRSMEYASFGGGGVGGGVDDARERSMSIVGQALKSLTSKLAPDRHPSTASPSTGRQSQSQAPNAPSSPSANLRRTDGSPGQNAPSRRKARASQEGVRVARHMSAVFTRARKFAQSKSAASTS